jgi:hypothetical protein
MRLVTFIAISQLSAILAAHAAVVAPYTNDFSGSGSNVALPNESTDAQWNVVDGSYINSYSVTSGTASSASIDITNLDGVSFTMSTQFTMTSATAPNSNNASQIGFGAFSSAAGFLNTASDSYYLADFTYSANNLQSGNPLGTLRIVSLQAGSNPDFSSTLGLAVASGSAANFALVLNTTYTLQLTGTVTGGVLSMSLSLLDATGTIQIGTSATATDATPLTGDYFGYRDRLGAGGAMSVAYDNLSIVPEPSICVLAAIGLGLVLVTRRRTLIRR